MAWIHRCFVWVTLISNPSYCYNDYIDYPHYHGDYNPGHQRDLVQNRRSDYSRTNDKPGDRYIDYSESDEEPRHNERSIPYNYNTQRVHEQSRRRTGSTDDGVRRHEDSSFKIVNNLSKPYPIISNRRGGIAQQDENRPSMKDSVVFPGPTSRTSSFVPQITDPECLKNGICENIPNYPEDRVNEILKQLEGTKYRFNYDKLDAPEIAQRIGSHEELLSLCKSNETLVPPRAVRDKNDQWYIVVNQRKKPQQAFRVEICQPEHAPCSTIIYVDSSTYNTTCIQKYQYRQMAVLNKEGNLVEMEFPLPSCCSCALQVLNLRR